MLSVDRTHLSIYPIHFVCEVLLPERGRAGLLGGDGDVERGGARVSAVSVDRSPTSQRDVARVVLPSQGAPPPTKGAASPFLSFFGESFFFFLVRR